MECVYFVVGWYVLFFGEVGFDFCVVVFEFDEVVVDGECGGGEVDVGCKLCGIEICWVVFWVVDECFVWDLCECRICDVEWCCCYVCYGGNM